MSRTLIQKDASALVESFIERAKVLNAIEHKLTQGTLKELFTSELLQHFLTIQFGIGSGIVINDKNKQSNQTDIVIYDKRIIPPFISGSGIGVYPVESVIATIEIKTELHKDDLMEAEKAARKLSEKVFTRRRRRMWPLCAAFGFKGGIRGLTKEAKSEKWLRNNVQYLKLLCITGKYSWGTVQRQWKPGSESFAGCHDETKRFLALLLDNLRTLAERRYRLLTQEHQDWFSSYIRG
jgi:hypothetical protein